MSENQAWLVSVTPPRGWKRAGPEWGPGSNWIQLHLNGSQGFFSCFWASRQSSPDPGPGRILLSPDPGHPSLNSCADFHVWLHSRLHSPRKRPQQGGCSQGPALYANTFWKRTAESAKRQGELQQARNDSAESKEVGGWPVMK